MKFKAILVCVFLVCLTGCSTALGLLGPLAVIPLEMQNESKEDAQRQKQLDDQKAAEEKEAQEKKEREQKIINDEQSLFNKAINDNSEASCIEYMYTYFNNHVNESDYNTVHELYKKLVDNRSKDEYQKANTKELQDKYIIDFYRYDVYYHEHFFEYKILSNIIDRETGSKNNTCDVLERIPSNPYAVKKGSYYFIERLQIDQWMDDGFIVEIPPAGNDGQEAVINNAYKKEELQKNIAYVFVKCVGQRTMTNLLGKEMVLPVFDIVCYISTAG